jgi:hypothetical protein
VTVGELIAVTRRPLWHARRRVTGLSERTQYPCAVRSRGVVLLWLALSALVASGVGYGTARALSPTSAPTGDVCGVVALAGGASSAVGVKNPALLHVCPSGERAVRSLVGTSFRLMSSTGETYAAQFYVDTGWSAQVPAGRYRAVDRSGCRVPGPTFTVSPRRTLLGVVVWVGCGFM